MSRWIFYKKVLRLEVGLFNLDGRAIRASGGLRSFIRPVRFSGEVSDCRGVKFIA
jgi:hypothetical protein